MTIFCTNKWSELLIQEPEWKVTGSKRIWIQTSSVVEQFHFDQAPAPASQEGGSSPLLVKMAAPAPASQDGSSGFGSSSVVYNFLL